MVFRVVYASSGPPRGGGRPAFRGSRGPQRPRTAEGGPRRERPQDDWTQREGDEPAPAREEREREPIMPNTLSRLYAEMPKPIPNVILKGGKSKLFRDGAFLASLAAARAAHN